MQESSLNTPSTSVCGPFGLNSHIFPFEACKNDLASHPTGLEISAKRERHRESTTSEKELIRNSISHLKEPQ